MVYVPRKSRRGTRKPRMRRNRRALGVKSVKTIARSVVAENREKKLKQFFINNYKLSPYNGGDFNLGINTVSMVCLSPNDIGGTYPSANLTISQGSQVDQRVGNRLEMKKGVIRLMMTPAVWTVDYNSDPQPLVVQIFIGYDRTTGNGQPSATLPDFYENNGSSLAPTGQLSDTFRKVNRERYVIFNRRTYKLGQAEFFGSTSSSETIKNQYYTNNDFKYCIKTSFDYSKHLIKTVKYSNDVNNTPTTRQLWMWWLVTPATGLATTSTRSVVLNAEATIQYTDA